MLTRKQAKKKLKKLGLSYRVAAPILGVSYPHLSYVLNGHRDSRRLLQAIDDLNPGYDWATQSDLTTGGNL